ncbi:MAG: asparagine synthetase B [Candidatus Bathyarchaeia archaeon]
MGGLISLVSRRGENVIPEAIKVLGVLRHRGAVYGVSTDSATFGFEDLESLTTLLRDTKSSIALGYIFNPILLGDAPQPIEWGEFRIAFDGRGFRPPLGASAISNIVGRFSSAKDAAESIIRDVDGSFAFVILEDSGRMFAGRDPMGAKPLYLGVSERLYALASERKALWALGIGDECIRSLPPGSLVEISESSLIIRPVKTLEKPKIRLIGGVEAVQELHRILLESVRKRTVGLEAVSVPFSGGLDSTVIAALAVEAGVRPLLISVGLEGSEDLEHAEKVAGEIGLPIKAKAYTIEDVEETLPKVIWLIEEDNALKASIYIPLFWAAETSSGMGFRAMLSGQGSDELFAGYHKYLKDYCRSEKDLEQTLYNDVLRLHEASLEPEEKVCSFHSVEVIFPYVDYDLASLALSLPASMKIASADDPLRKRILRHLARHMGLPQEVYLRPKKAIQYGSGVSKALNRIARRKGLKMHELVSQIFRGLVV